MKRTCGPSGSPRSRACAGKRWSLLASRPRWPILAAPDLLILDEPTNHLDLSAVEWLEGWLRDWPGAALIVSHDRYFLDRTVDSIWDLTPRGVETYHGGYTAYAAQRAERARFQAAAYQSQQQQV